MGADEFGGLLDREQVLGGAPARRAATLLFLIETRTARLVAQSRQRLERPLTEETRQERALAFVEAFALARETAVQPTVHDLERQADRWAPLVPRNARLQAALARRLGEKYRFTARVAHGIRKALGLDEPAVRDAYQALYGESIESVFAAELNPRERLRWTWTALAKRLENLPPFWTAYSLTLTETVGASILALPIALASLGPLPGVVILVILGLVNVMTVCLMAEAVVRSGPMRYGNAFVGRLVEGYLGSRGSLALTVLLAAFSFIALPVYYVGVGTTLEEATSVPAAVWVAALFLATLSFVRRGSLNATVAAALAVGAVNVLLIIALSALAFAHVNGANLLHAEIPFTNGRPFEASVVAVVFGVVLMAYFGHLSAALCGSLVLERDPSGRSLVRGCAGAQVTAVVIYCLFVLAMNGAVGADGFAGVTGTALEPLAGVAGFGVDIVGSMFVILALGMVSIIEALSLFGLAHERIPLLAPRVVVLPRRRGHLVFHARRNGLRAGLTYLGPAADGFRFSVDVERAGRLEHSEIIASTSCGLLPEDGAGRHRVALEVIDADERRARVAVTTTLRTAYEGELDGTGLDLAEVLHLSAAEAALVASLARLGEADAAAVAAGSGRSESDALAMIEGLVARGVVSERQTRAGPRFSARMAPRRARRSRVWEALADDPKAVRPPAGASPARSKWVRDRRAVLLGRHGRFVLAVLPLVAAFVLGEWFVLTGAGSFAGLLSFLGVIVVSLLAGLLPVLLLVSSRRKGEYAPGTRYAFLGRPVLLAAVYLLFVGALFAHGLVIWDDPVERVCALAAGLAMLVIPAILARGGAFARRLTFEIRDDQRSGSARFAYLAAERPVSSNVTLEYEEGELRPEGLTGEIATLDSLRRVVFQLRRDREPLPEQVKVWVHRVTPEGESESLPATARVAAGGRVEAADLSLSRGEAVFPVAGAELEVEIALRESAAQRD
jgi:amino acid permease